MPDQAETPYIKTDSTLARKRLRLRMSERADFQTVSILFRADQALATRIFLSFSVELILLPKYVNDSTDSIDSPETVCIEPCWLKLLKLVLMVHSKVEYLLFSIYR